MKDITREFIEVVADSAAQAADNCSKAGLDKLLADVNARDVAAIMGGDADPRQVSLDDAGWQQLAKLVSFQRGCVVAEQEEWN